MKLIDKAALVAEINRLQEATMDKNQNFLSSYHEGIFDGLSMFENFLDTLEVKEVGVDFGDPQGDIGVKWVQEEPASKDLEEAACEYDNSHIDDNNLSFKAGAQWQREQMITKACEWLKENKDHPFIECEDPCLSGYLTDEFIEDFKKYMEE